MRFCVGGLLVGILAVLACAACGSKTTTLSTSASAGANGSTECQAGDTRACVGPGACAGGQACDNNGRWTTCDCGSGGTAEVGSSGATSGGNGGTSGTSGGAGPGGGSGGVLGISGVAGISETGGAGTANTFGGAGGQSAGSGGTDNSSGSSGTPSAAGTGGLTCAMTCWSTGPKSVRQNPWTRLRRLHRQALWARAISINANECAYCTSFPHWTPIARPTSHIFGETVSPSLYLDAETQMTRTSGTSAVLRACNGDDEGKLELAS